MAKSNMDVLEEWIKTIKKFANDGYECNGESMKNLHFQRILGQCDSILATVKCCQQKKEG